jgi:hypothetical protein
MLSAVAEVERFLAAAIGVQEGLDLEVGVLVFVRIRYIRTV